MNKKTNKFKKLSSRHEMPIVKSFFYEAYVRMYRYSPAFRSLSRLFISTKTPKQIFFIVGSYNAGTTIVKRAIAAHPSIASLPIEGDLLTSELSNMEEGGWHRCLYGNKEQVNNYRKSVDIDAEKLFKDWSPWIKKDQYFLEKSIANSIRIKQLRKAFPDCKFINVIRSPDGVINGIKKRSKPTDEARKKLGSDAYPDKLLYCQWSYIYGLIRLDSKPEDTFDISYEKFIDNPESSTKAIFDFLGIDANDIEFKANTLMIGSKKLYIRPSQNNKMLADYSNPELLASEIKRLNCD